MARKARKAALEMDAGRGSMPGMAMAAETPLAEFFEKETNREGLAELDRMTEASDRLSRAQKDRERITPRDATGDVNPRTSTRVPEFDEIRTPISGRQMKERSRLKRDLQERWTAAQHRAMSETMASPQRWQQLTDQLAAEQGDADAMSTRDQLVVQRIDRTIRQYEELNDRQHLVYANVELPASYDTAKLTKQPVVHLDRWTAGSHNLHEISEPDAVRDNVYALEISTQRGMYLGHSDGGRKASHLLPRGMSFTVEKVYEARWTAPDGTRGTRRVIRLKEIHQEG